MPLAPAPALLSVASAVPPHVLAQADVAAQAERLFAGRFAGWNRLAGVFASTGIRTRSAVRPMEWYLEPKGWPERTAAYLGGGTDLFVDAADRALERAGLSAAEVDTIVTVSSTGIATPSLEARAAARLGFRADIRRVPVFGLGCAGGIAGLALAARLAAAEPGSVVLLVAIELCTLSFRLDTPDKADIVAAALFGDGAAACVLSTGARGPHLVTAAGDHTWPDTLGIMGWDVGNDGFGVIFDRAIPPFVTAELGAALDAVCRAEAVDRSKVDRFVCHPGGTKVLAALESALTIEPGSLDIEREVLAEFGNMSAPTVLFVLERAAARGPLGSALLMAMGPGFTLSCAALRSRE